MKRAMFEANRNVPTSQLSAAEEAALEKLADEEFEAGVGIPLEEAVAWVDSWFTPNELPAPKARKLD
jgi:predicted transcriptional regulator